MKTVTTILLLLLLAAAQASALSLDEAVAAALQNHQRIAQYRASADQSQANVGIAKASFMPRVDVNYSYLQRDEDPYALGEKSATLSLGASINLFNGLSDYHNYRVAQSHAESASFILQGTQADIVLATQQAYIEALRAAHSVTTALEGVELLERQKRDTALKFEYGLIARNDLLRIEVELSSARQDLLRAEGQQQIALRQLERSCGLQILEAKELQELAENALIQVDSNLSDSYRTQMLAHRSELNYLRSEIEAVQRERLANRGSYLPRVDLSLSREEYADQLSPLSSDDEDNLLRLSASWNLFDGFAREKKIAVSNAKARALSAQLRDTEASITLQLDSALQNTRIARGRQLEANSGVTSAEENYRVTNNRFQQQQATTVDLLDAQFLLTRARNLEINARYDLLLSSALLERIIEVQEKQP